MRCTPRTHAPAEMRASLARLCMCTLRRRCKLERTPAELRVLLVRQLHEPHPPRPPEVGEAVERRLAAPDVAEICKLDRARPAQELVAEETHDDLEVLLDRPEHRGFLVARPLF